MVSEFNTRPRPRTYCQRRASERSTPNVGVAHNRCFLRAEHFPAASLFLSTRDRIFASVYVTLCLRVRHVSRRHSHGSPIFTPTSHELKLETRDGTEFKPCGSFRDARQAVPSPWKRRTGTPCSLFSSMRFINIRRHEPCDKSVMPQRERTRRGKKREASSPLPHPSLHDAHCQHYLSSERRFGTRSGAKIRGPHERARARAHYRSTRRRSRGAAARRLRLAMASPARNDPSLVARCDIALREIAEIWLPQPRSRSRAQKTKMKITTRSPFTSHATSVPDPRGSPAGRFKLLE